MSTVPYNTNYVPSAEESEVQIMLQRNADIPTAVKMETFRSVPLVDANLQVCVPA